MPLVQVFKITRPCGCATPVVAIHTNRKRDRISLPAHSYQVNQYCHGPHTGSTTIQGWLTVVQWIKAYVKPPARRKARQDIQRQCLDLKENHPRIPETFLI